MKSDMFFQPLPVCAAYADSADDRSFSKWSLVKTIFIVLVVLVASVAALSWEQDSNPRSLVTDDEDPVQKKDDLRADQRKPVFDLKVTPNSESLFFRSIGGEVYRLNLVGLESGPALTPLFPNRFCLSFVMSPDATHLVASFVDGRVVVRAIDNPHDEHVLGSSKEDPFEFLAYSPDGTLAAAASAEGQVCVWKVKSKQVVTSFRRIDDRVSCLAFDSELGLLVSRETGLERWVIDPSENSSDRRRLDWKIEGHSLMREMVVSPDGRFLISSSFPNVLSVMDLRRREQLWERSGKTPATRGIVLNADAGSFFCLSAENSLVQYDLLTGRQRLSVTVRSGSESGTSLAWAGDRLYMASVDGRIGLWSIVDRAIFGRIDTADL